MRVFITGICGFIGTNLAAHLHSLDYDVVGMDCSFWRQNYEFLSDLGIAVKAGDVMVLRDLKKHMKGADAVIHLAAKTSARTAFSSSSPMMRANMLGTHNVASVSMLYGVKKLLFASSGAVYGVKKEKLHPYLSYCRPVNVYGLTKLVGEQLFRLVEEENLYCDVYRLRIANVYGPWCSRKNSLVAVMMRSILSGEDFVIHGSGDQRRDFIYVKDLCEKIERCLSSQLTPGVYNMATGKSVSVNQVATELAKVVNFPEPWHDLSADCGVRDIVFEVSGLSHGNLPPNRTLRDGLEETWDWAEENMVVDLRKLIWERR